MPKIITRFRSGQVIEITHFDEESKRKKVERWKVISQYPEFVLTKNKYGLKRSFCNGSLVEMGLAKQEEHFEVMRRFTENELMTRDKHYRLIG